MSTFRKIIQITTVPLSTKREGYDQWMLYALCDDGSMWYRNNLQSLWARLETASITDINLRS